MTPTATERDLKYIRLAQAGAKIFSTCTKAQYFAILVNPQGTIVGTGYNGAPPGQPHCTDGACPRANTTTQGGSYNNCVAIHAEANLLLRVTPQECQQGTLYINGLPCLDCMKLIAGARIPRIVYTPGRKPIDETTIRQLAADCGIKLVETNP